MNATIAILLLEGESKRVDRKPNSFFIMFAISSENSRITIEV